ncbi:MAG: DevR family CRISPR-associated autoregulator [Ignavibacteria bacterium]|mgnify:CR=1 FL=1|nr:DevR family CRISPR-associated autoregulator [Ignavibacteria bacterium]
MNRISSISISGRITLNMHSLNNEGNEGNQVLTRQVTIVDENGKPVTVTAVSGDMLKHIFSEHFWKIANEQGLNLSDTSKVFNANRIVSKDLKNTKKDDLKKQDLAMDEVIKTCALSDISGAMITDIGNFARKSVVEFGWLIGMPDSNETENYFHAKYVSNASDTEKDSGNLGQNIFHRPANSGQYAFVSNMEISRLGYNDITKEYSINADERKKRYKALLKSMLYTIVKPNGAMRNTQNPHIVNFEGAISYSTSSCPAPTVSAINKSYKEEIEKVTTELNKIASDSLKIEVFSSLSEFSNKFVALINDTEPNELNVTE